MTGLGDERSAQDYAQCEALVRAGDYDRWLATLFAPADKRPHLFALLAFSLEAARIPELVSEPRMGEIRLQWWREALEGARDELASHPVAAALARTRERFRLPLDPFVALIDARVFDLWHDPAPSLAWLEGYCGDTSSVLFRLAALILSDPEDPGGADAAGHAGLAWALVGLLRALPWRAEQGRVFIPRDLLARHELDPADVLARRVTPSLRDALADMRLQARVHLAEATNGVKTVSPLAKSAFAPLALVELYLRRMERPGYDPFRTPVDLPAWRKVAALWLSRAR